MDYRVQVSIYCLAYNHEKYIRKCLDGFVMQKDVTFEIIIHDDASTDHTADIIREYEQRYPELFKPIYQTENQYSQHINIGQNYMVPLISGKYVAFCEGDDYWTDPYKLKKQYDALESNPDCYMCLHKVERVKESGLSAGAYIPLCDFTTGKMTSKQFYESFAKAEMFQTSSFFFCSDKYIEYRTNPPVFRRVSPVGDFPTLLYFSFIGNVYYINEEMSCYRYLSDNSWSRRFNTDTPAAWRIREVHIAKMRLMMDEFFKYSKGLYSNELSFVIKQLDRMETMLQDDKYWYCIKNKDFKRLFKEFTISELRDRGLSSKAIIKMKLQQIIHL